MSEQRPTAWRPLGQVFVDKGLLTQEELEQALGEQQSSGRRLGEVLISLGLISAPSLARALGEQYGIEIQTDDGFGSGLLGQIERRHRSERRRLAQTQNGNGGDEDAQAASQEAEPPADAEPEALPQPVHESEFTFEPEPVATIPVAQALYEEFTVGEFPAEAPQEQDSLAERVDENAAKLAAIVADVDQLSLQVERAMTELSRMGSAVDRLEQYFSDLEARLAAPAEQTVPEDPVVPSSNGAASTNGHHPESETAAEEDAPAADPEPVAEPLVEEHVLFVPSAPGYRLAERSGPAPAVGETVDLDQAPGVFVVAKIGRAPFPGDRRPCAFLELVWDAPVEPARDAPAEPAAELLALTE